MKKSVSKFLSVILSFMLVLGAMPFTAMAETLTWSFNNGTLTISGTGAMDDYDESDPAWNSKLLETTKIVVSEGVTYIGKYAFSGFTNATQVELPKSLETVGEWAFSFCSGIESVSIAQNSKLRIIRKDAFYRCYALESITIPESVTNILASAFNGCTALESVTFEGDSIDIIDTSAFAGVEGASINLNSGFKINYPGGSGTSQNPTTITVNNGPTYFKEKNFIFIDGSNEVYFVNDGTILQRNGNVASGTTVSYTGTTPTKSGGYEFAGWDPAIGAITKDTIYTATFNQTKTDPDVTAPTPVIGLVENGTDKALVSGGSVTGGTMYYKVLTDESVTPSPSDEGWSTDVPMESAANTYYVWYYVKGDSAHNDTDPAKVTATIAPAPTPVLPTATVTDITDTAENTANLDKAYKFVANNDSTDYDSYQADFVVTFTQDVTSDDLELWGKYGQYDWTAISSEAAGQTVTYTANTPYYLLKDIIKAPMTYGEIASIVGTFWCGIKAKPTAAGTGVDVSFVIYDGEAATPEPITIEQTDEYVVPSADNGVSLTLTDKIETTIYIDADAYGVDASEAVVKATYNHNAADTAPSVSTDEFALSELPQYSGQTEKYVGTYMFTYACAPAQLTEECEIEVYENSEASTPVFTETYSAKSYCDKVNAAYAAAENPDAALTKLNALCDSLVDYAKAAQFQFDYSKDLTDAYRNEAVQTLTAGDITATANVKTSDVAGFAFDCQDELNILVYTNSAVAPTGVSMNATKYADKINAAADSKDSTNFIRVKGLGSGNINKVVTVNTANGDITVSANAIVKAYLGSDAVSSNMKDLARAIYLYGAAAADYFGA